MSLKSWLDDMDRKEGPPRPRTPFFPGKDRKVLWEKAFRIYGWPGHENPGMPIAQHFHGPGKMPTPCPGAENNCPECLESMSAAQMGTAEGDKLAEDKKAARQVWFNAVCTETFSGSNTTDPNVVGILTVTEGVTKKIMGFAAQIGGYMGEKSFNPKDPEFHEAVEKGFQTLLGPEGKDVIIKHDPSQPNKTRYSVRIRTKDNRPLTIAPNDVQDLAAVKERLDKKEN